VCLDAAAEEAAAMLLYLRARVCTPGPAFSGKQTRWLSKCQYPARNNLRTSTALIMSPDERRDQRTTSGT
jgi:hypothetical protein